MAPWAGTAVTQGREEPWEARSAQLGTPRPGERWACQGQHFLSSPDSVGSPGGSFNLEVIHLSIKHNPRNIIVM
jgi:hypothetical protein